MTFTYDFPQASPCSNISLYTKNGNTVRLLITDRDASVGKGKSLSAGGFDEVKDAFGRAGEMIDGIEETYREMHEELGEEIKEIIPYEDFKARVQYLWDGMVPTSKHPLVEKVVMRYMEVSEAEMDAIMALPSTSEQVGKKLIELELNDDAQAASTDFTSLSDDFNGFKYPHEVVAAQMLLQRLETQARASAPSTGPGW
jgi:hypothetical protein